MALGSATDSLQYISAPIEVTRHTEACQGILEIDKLSRCQFECAFKVEFGSLIVLTLKK